jgi:hypothetical protein
MHLEDQSTPSLKKLDAVPIKLEIKLEEHATQMQN